jgi:hypothetical protein
MWTVSDNNHTANTIYEKNFKCKLDVLMVKALNIFLRKIEDCLQGENNFTAMIPRESEAQLLV